MERRGPGAIRLSECDGKSGKSSVQRGHHDSCSGRIPLAREWGTDLGRLGCVAQDAFRCKQLKPALTWYSFNLTY